MLSVCYCRSASVNAIRLYLPGLWP